jgi:hypothetical protein
MHAASDENFWKVSQNINNTVKISPNTDDTVKKSK